MHPRSAMKTCNSGIQRRYATQIRTDDMQRGPAVQICSANMKIIELKILILRSTFCKGGPMPSQKASNKNLASREKHRHVLLFWAPDEKNNTPGRHKSFVFFYRQNAQHYFVPPWPWAQNAWCAPRKRYKSSFQNENVICEKPKNFKIIRTRHFFSRGWKKEKQGKIEFRHFPDWEPLIKSCFWPGKTWPTMTKTRKT